MPNIIEPTDGRPIRLGDYIVHGLIGEGGMARVYAGEEVMSRRRVAIKILRTELAHSEQVRRLFLTEMGILANLDDPHIVRCLLCTEFEGRPVMVLERLEGWTLRAMLDTRTALPWIEVVHYALQIAKALRTAHSRTPPIVHRDLKPENVMILPDGHVKVMDFGIAKIVQSVRGGTNHDVGTPQYMSPEAIDALAIDGRADLFTLGLLMWEMLVGRPPFTGDSPRILLERICSQATPRLPDHVRQQIPPHLEALIHRLLEKDPRARPANANEVIALLEPWTKPVAPHAPRVSPSVPPRPSPAPTQPRPHVDTIQIVEAARKRPFERSVEQHAEAIAQELSRFARATSTRIVRVLVGLLALPAAAVLFIGVPAVLSGVGYSLLEDDGVKLDESDVPAWLTDQLVIGLAILIVVVFVRACWAHHRKPLRFIFSSPWWLLGVILNVSWIIWLALELAPKNSLNIEAHAFFIVACFAWNTVTMSWAIGRMTSSLFQWLERPRAGP